MIHADTMGAEYHPMRQIQPPAIPNCPHLPIRPRLLLLTNRFAGGGGKSLLNLQIRRIVYGDTIENTVIYLFLDATSLERIRLRSKTIIESKSLLSQIVWSVRACCETVSAHPSYCTNANSSSHYATSTWYWCKSSLSKRL